MIKKRLAKKALSARYFFLLVDTTQPEAEPIMVPRNPRCYDIIYKACVRMKCPQVIEDIEANLAKLV